MKRYLREIKKNILKNLTRLPTKFGMLGPLLLMKMERLRKILKSLMQVRVKEEIGNLTKTEIPFMKLKVQEI
jgi:hypothetical protein